MGYADDVGPWGRCLKGGRCSGWLTTAGGGVNGDSERLRRQHWLTGVGAAVAGGEGASIDPKQPNHVSVHGGVGSAVEGTRGLAESHRQLVDGHGGSVTLSACKRCNTKVRKGK